MSREKAAPARPGIVTTRHRLAPEHEIHHGLRVAKVPEILLACARDLGHLDLIVAIDSAIHLGLTTLDDLSLIASRRARGAPRLRRAIPWVDGRSESAWETMLRVLHVSCGVEVQPQVDVHDAEGVFVARGDLWLVGTRMLHEYDGAHHLERSRQRQDLRRVGRLDDTSWSRRGFTKEDVLHQAVAVLRSADRALARAHDPSRIRAWNQLLRDSLWTPAGRAQFRARIGMPIRERSELGA